MSWLFGNSTKTSSSQDEKLAETLGFDPNQVNDVSKLFNNGGINILDTAKLHPLAGLDKGIEYLDLEDDQLSTVEGSQGLIPSRSWTDDLCYGTGAVYLSGLGLGGLYGFQEGIKAIPHNSTGKLKLNTILNHITKRGPFLGNSAGVIALTYNLIDSSFDALRGKHDDYNSIAAGALAGAIFRSGRGIKPMGYSSLIVAGAAATWCAAKKVLSQ